MMTTLNALLRPLLGATLSGAVLASTALAQTQNPPQQPPRNTEATPRGTGRVADADADFLKQAMYNNNAEVEASRLAVAKANGSQVKEFAQKMVDEHSATDRELRALASAKGVTISNDPSLMQRGKLAVLSARDRDTFDRRYIDAIVDAHQEAVDLFQRASTNSSDPEVKAFAARTLPTLQQHLQHAQQLKNQPADSQTSPQR